MLVKTILNILFLLLLVYLMSCEGSDQIKDNGNQAVQRKTRDLSEYFTILQSLMNDKDSLPLTLLKMYLKNKEGPRKKRQVNYYSDNNYSYNPRRVQYRYVVPSQKQYIPKMRNPYYDYNRIKPVRRYQTNNKLIPYYYNQVRTPKPNPKISERISVEKSTTKKPFRPMPVFA